MGDMADYYDERDEYGHVESNSARTDRMADEHGFAHTSIGYVPITARRGGIKYPERKAPMPSLNHQLTALKNKQENLAAEIANLERKVKAQRKAPPAGQSMWSIDVRFTSNGTLYKYLILRHGPRFYTTGTGDDRVFYSWDSLLGWLDNVNAHGPLMPLVTDVDVASALEARA